MLVWLSLEVHGLSGRFSGRVFVGLLVVAVVLNLLGLYLFFRVDGVVHGDLYDFGLVFSGVWASAYWSCALSLKCPSLGVSWVCSPTSV